MNENSLVDLPTPRPSQLAYLREIDPDAYQTLSVSTRELKKERERIRYEDSLIEFMARAWREIDGAELSVNWHHEVIAEHLEAIAYGQLRYLIINIPPRHTKTLLANVFFPAWVWAQRDRLSLSGPHVKFLSVSYGANLSEEIAVKMRRLVMGEWYQSLWGHRVKIRDDQKNRSNFANTAGGERLSNSIEGGLIGRGGDIQLIDDPHNLRGAESDAERESTLKAFSEGLTTRITDPRIVAKVLIMQRLHESDCTAWALENWPRGTVHLMFPARFIPDQAVPQDRRTLPGELLWPDVWTNEELTKIEAGLAGIEKGEPGLSAYAVAGQLQQSPIPRGGGIIAANDWAVYPEDPPNPEDMLVLPSGMAVIPLPEVSYVLLALDTNMSERELADWNACTVFGIWHRRRNLVSSVNQHRDRWTGVRLGIEPAKQTIIEEDEQPRAILMEAWRRRGKLNEEGLDIDGKPKGLVQRVIETARRRRVDKILIENKTRGKDVADEIRRQTRNEEFQIEMFEPGQHGDKVARLTSTQPLFAQRLVYAPANCVLTKDKYGNQCVDVREFLWVDMVRNEVASVPKGRHDDLADCVSSSLIWLRKFGFLPLTQEHIAETLQARMLDRDPTSVARHYGV